MLFYMLRFAQTVVRYSFERKHQDYQCKRKQCVDKGTAIIRYTEILQAEGIDNNV